MRISDWSSDVCSSDLVDLAIAHVDLYRIEDADELIELGLDEYLYDGALLIEWPDRLGGTAWPQALALTISGGGAARSEEHTSEIQSLMRISYAVFCLKKKKKRYKTKDKSSKSV